MSKDIGGAICDFVAGFGLDDAPESTRAVLGLSVLDWAAVALAGQAEPVAVALRDLVAAEAGTPEASVIGLPEKLPARAAALANGACSHALDYDDTHFLHIGHPSVVVVSAALAMAERTGASGSAFLAAALAGFEASCRIGHWLGRSHYEAGFHQTATAGAFGATLAAGKLLGLDAERLRHALGLAATRASGLKSQFGTMGKPYNAGIAAANGVEVALLAASGFISRPDGLDCDQGFGPTHAGAATPLGAVLDGLGTRFVLDEVSHKFHACCHGTHAALEAMQMLRRDGMQKDDIGHVIIHTHPRWLGVCNIAEPSTGLEAKFSYRLTAAMAFSGYDTGRLDSFTDAVCADDALIALRDRVKVSPDASLTDGQARVEVQMASGDRLEAQYDLDAPLPLAERAARVEAKAAGLLGPSRFETLRAHVADLAQAESVAAFTAALRAG